MVDVDDDFGYAEGAQAGESDFEKCAAGEFDEGLGAIVGERTEARAEAGGEDHGFHWSRPQKFKGIRINTEGAEDAESTEKN